MSERRASLEAFDREFEIPPGVSIVAVEIPFWNLVNLVFKVYFAFLVASFMLGFVIGTVWLVWFIVTN
jgi:hypothetical protein